MKESRRPIRSCLLVALVVSGPLACGSEPPAADEGSEPAGARATASIPADSAATARVAARARPVAAALMTTLSGRLQEAIRERGTAGALEFCNVEALPLTAQVAEEHGMEVTRTSLRVRNPGNAPDAADAEALEWFQAGLAAGSVPPALHVRRLRDGGFRYYQPLMTAELCVQCHGRREEMAPEVVRALDERYPEDRATGYAVGDWRGLLRVTVPDTSAEGH